MDAERWQRLSPLLDTLLEEEPSRRAAHLAALRAEDPQLADDLLALLSLEEDNDAFLSEPLVAPVPGLRSGGLVGPYKLERMLGEGGMGQVWSAGRADGLYQKRVALKLLRPGLANPDLRLRFTRERQILARLEHPHIARLLDAGISADGQPYLALEYVEGEPITDWCQAHDLSLQRRLQLFGQICQAVSHAHANLIVHRDLKPSNILVTALDEVRLLDFGIAKLIDSGQFAPEQTRTGVRAFTLHYAAPEQVRGEPVTTMTDVYSLGVVLYELLSDTRPYRLKRQSDAEWEEAILNADPLRPSQALLRGGETGEPTPALRKRARLLTGDLDRIVLKALAKRPEHRYASVEALAQDLHRYREGKPVLARPQSLGYRLRKYVRRHRWTLATAAFISLVVVSAFGIVAWQAQRAVDEAARAQAMQDFVVGLFEQAGERAVDTPLDVRVLLDRGVQRIDHELAQQPGVRAELYGVVARLRLGLGDYAQALALLRRQQRLIDTQHGLPDSVRLAAATDLGRTQRLLGRPQACVQAMAGLAPLAGRQQDQLPAQAAEFYSQLGRCRRALSQRGTARLLFQRSLALRRDPLADAAGVVENLADLANLHADAGDTRTAQREYRQALAQLHDGVGERHPLGIDLRRNLCAIERAEGHVALAERQCRAALALGRELRGDRHPMTIDARRQLAAIHADQGRFAEAEAAFRRSRQWLIARLGPHHTAVARDDNSLGVIAWEHGDFRAALAAFDHGIAILRSASQRNNLSDVLFNKAMVLHEVGSDAEALSLLREARALRVAQTGPQHALVGDADRLIGEAHDALGQAAPARQALTRALAYTRAGYGAAHPHTYRAMLSLARHRARHGEADAAAGQFDAVAALAGTDAESAKLRWRARAYAAELRCRDGDALAGRTALQLLQADMRAVMPEGGHIAREVAAISDTCR